MAQVNSLARGVVGAARMLPLAALCCLALLAQSAQAQAPASEPRETETDANGYLMFKPNEFADPKNRLTLGQAKNQIMAIIQGRGTPPAAQLTNQFGKYFRGYLFPVMTRTSDEELKDLANHRTALLRDLENCKSPEAYAELKRITLADMTHIVRNNFHPGVRYNAMLVLSSLNDVEAVRVGSETRLPEPMMQALPIILEEFTRAENSDAIKVATLLGLSRHLEWDPYKPQNSRMSAENRSKVLAALVALAETKDPPEGRAPEGHQWMRRRAVEALSLAATTRPEPAIAQSLEKILRDDTEPLPLRCTAASCIGKLQYQDPVKLDLAGTAKELGYLAMVVCDRELTRLDSLKKIEQDRKAKMGALGGYGGGYGGGMPGDGYDPGYDSAGGGYDPYGGGMPGGMPGGSGGYGTPGANQGPRPVRPPGGSAAGGSAGGAPGYGGSAMGPYGPSYGATTMQDPKAYRFEYARRRIRQQLYTIQLGLTGGDDIVPPRPGASEQEFKSGGVITVTKAGTPERQAIERIHASLKKMILAVEAADPQAADLTKLDQSLRREIRTMETLTRKLAAPAVPAAAPLDVPGGAPGAIPEESPAPAPAPPTTPTSAPAGAGVAR